MWKSVIVTLLAAAAIGIVVEMQTGYLKYQLATQLRAAEPGSVFALLAKRIMLTNEIPSQQLVDLINPSPGSVVLEIGPGLGFGLEYLFGTYQPKQVYGMELSMDLFKGLKIKFADQFKTGQLKVYNQDAKNMAFLEDNSVDAIYALNVIYFLDPLSEYLQEFHRVLKPGGILAFGVFDEVKTMDSSIFVNQDWSICLEQMKRIGLEKTSTGVLNGSGGGKILKGTKPITPPPSVEEEIGDDRQEEAGKEAFNDDEKEEGYVEEEKDDSKERGEEL